MLALLVCLCPLIQPESGTSPSIQEIAETLSKTMVSAKQTDGRTQTQARVIEGTQGPALQLTIQYFQDQEVRPTMIETHKVTLTAISAVESVCPGEQSRGCYLRLRFQKDPGEKGGFTFEIEEPSSQLVQTLQLGPYEVETARRLVDWLKQSRIAGP